MSEKISVNGACLCGKVGLKSESATPSIGACHCGMCRKWTGSPLMAVDCGTQVSFTGAESIGVYESSDWAERGFCSHCGTHLFYRLKQNQLYIVPAGLLELDDRYVFDHQIFIEAKPSFYCFANETKNMTGEEVFAAYS